MSITPRKLKKIDDEVWQVVPDCKNQYQVSNYGRVKSFAFNKNVGQILKFSEVKGFKQIRLKINKINRSFYVHKLVAEVWIPRPSEDHRFVTHIDGNLKNNSVSNLEWHTKDSLVEQHRISFLKKQKNSPRRKTINNSKLKESDIPLIKSMLHRGVMQVTIAKMFCISEMQVTRIKRGENWGHIQV